MSVCTFLAADYALPEIYSSDDYPVEIDLNRGTIYDGGAEDNFSLLRFEDTDLYSSLKYGVSLEWNYYTEGRANKLIAYIQEVLQHTDCVEIHHVWLGDFYEYEESPVLHKKTIQMDELSANHMKEIDEAELWNTPDKTYQNRPSFYCLRITK